MGTVLSYLKQLNWVDVFVVIVFIRTSYVAAKTGFPCEIFKLFGTLSATYLACHYYTGMGAFLNRHLAGFAGADAALDLFSFLSFCILAWSGYFLFVMIRKGLLSLLKIEATSLLNRWGAFAVSVCRCSLLVSLLFFTATLSNISYFRRSLSNSFTRPALFKPVPRTYQFLWNSLLSHFMDTSRLNKAVFNIEHNLTD